jgi:ribonuclease P protein component
MLPKKNKVNHALFDEIFKQGRYFVTDLMNGRYLIVSRSEKRIAVVVSKKIKKRSVERNRVKRRFYKAFYSLLPDLPSGTCMAVFINKAGADASLHFITQDISKTIPHLLKSKKS